MHVKDSTMRNVSRSALAEAAIVACAEVLKKAGDTQITGTLEPGDVQFILDEIKDQAIQRWAGSVPTEGGS